MSEKKEFTLKQIDRFKREYKEAVKLNKDFFIFDDQKIYTKYARYMIEHIDNIINNK